MTTATIDEQLAEHTIIHLIKKSKHKFVSLEQVSEFIKEKMGNEYSVKIGMDTRHILMSHPALDFFREGSYIHEQKFHFCAGNWVAIKGVYKNPVEAKNKLGWYSWQTSEEIDWSEV